MNIERKAIAEIKYLASLTKGLQALAENLGEAADLETIVQEKRTRIADLTAQERTLTDKIAACDAECARKRSDAQNAIDDASRRAENIQRIGQRSLEEANKAVADAKAEAAAIIEAAKVEARQAVTREVEAIKARL